MSTIFKAFRNLTKSRSPAASEAASHRINSHTVIEEPSNNKMAAQVLLNNGLKMPRIGLGTYGVKDKVTCLRVFSAAIDCGYRLFDTGTLYGNDSYIGDVVYDRLSSDQLKRNDIFLETKIAPYQHGRELTNKAVMDSLKNLKLSYIDLVLVHWPGVAKVPPTDPKNRALRRETWTELENLVEAGKIKSIGVSNYNENHLKDLLEYCKIKPTVNQVEFHPMSYRKSLLEFCEQNAIHLQAYSSLGSSQSKPPGWQVLFGNETIIAISKKHNKTIPQTLLRWGYQHNCLLIPKTSKVENLAPNLDILDFELDSDDMQKLNSLNADKRFCWNSDQIV